MSKPPSNEDINRNSMVDKLRIETAMMREEAAAYFEALARGIREGQLTLRQNGAELNMAIGNLPSVKVKASRKKSAGSIEVTLNWEDE